MSDTFKEQLTEAGNKFDGHVTNGSLEEQMKVIEAWLHQRLTALDILEARLDKLEGTVREANGS